MTNATEKQIAFIKALADQIAAIEVPAGRKISKYKNPYFVMGQLHALAAEAVAKCEAGDVTSRGASNWIDGLKDSLDRARRLAN